jgi:hypothetical protein
MALLALVQQVVSGRLSRLQPSRRDKARGVFHQRSQKLEFSQKLQLSLTSQDRSALAAFGVRVNFKRN